MNELPNTSLLVDSDWLQTNLTDLNLRVVDCSVTRQPNPPGASSYLSRGEEFRQAHIPGATYLHMVDDLSDPTGPFAFALPPADAIVAKLAERGIDNAQTIVLYGGVEASAVHRCWWVLKTAGFPDVRVLNESFDTWQQQGRPIESGRANAEGKAANPSAVPMRSSPRPAWLASKADVIASLADETVALVHSLSAEQFKGGGQPFGRPGRIPGSISVPAQALMNSETGAFIELATLRTAFANAGAPRYQKLITYCGGGIAASTTFLALTMLGYDNVSLYDGSLLEWSADPTLPLAVG